MHEVSLHIDMLVAAMFRLAGVFFPWSPLRRGGDLSHMR